MAAAGRDRFADLMANGTLKVDGNEALASELLEKVRIV